MWNFILSLSRFTKLLNISISDVCISSVYNFFRLGVFSFFICLYLLDFCGCFWHLSTSASTYVLRLWRLFYRAVTKWCTISEHSFSILGKLSHFVIGAHLKSDICISIKDICTGLHCYENWSRALWLKPVVSGVWCYHISVTP